MPTFFPRPSSRITKAEKLLTVLSDGDWHSTKELARRVGHTFPVATYKLRHTGHQVERRSHPTKPRQFQYRLAPARTP